MPLLRGGQVDWPQEVLVQISETQVGRCVRTKRWKYSVKAPEGNGLKDAGSSVYRDDCLYDLLADPYELTNLIGYESHRAVVEHLRSRLVARMVEAGETAPRIEDALSRESGQRFVADEEVWQ